MLAAWAPTVRRGDDATEVRGPGALRGVEVDLADLSDTAQTLAAVAAFADGPTRVTGIGFIRAKETDRIAAVVTELRPARDRRRGGGRRLRGAHPAPAAEPAARRRPTTTTAWP